MIKENSKNENYEYKKAIVVFLDILGFKDKIKNDTPKEIYGILNYINAWNTEDGVNDFIPEKVYCYEKYLNAQNIDVNKLCSDVRSELKVSTFSDSMIISLPYTEDEFNNKFFMIVYFTAYLMSHLAMSNYFCRGGISVGDMFHKKNIFFGEGFLKAYELEQIAIYPRVIFSKEIEEMFDKQMPYTKQFNDGLFGVDFLNFAKELRNNSVYLQPIEKLIDENINYWKDIQQVRMKYEWLKNQL